MRPIRTSALIVLFVLLLGAAPAAAEDWSLAAWAKRESPWKGHGVGSSVTETTTMQMPEMPNVPDMPDIPGMPKGGKMVTTTKTTLVGITETHYKLKVETTSMGRTMVSENLEPKVRSGSLTAADVGKGSVTVAGSAYDCTIKQVADMSELLGDSMPKGGPGMQPKIGAGKIWEHPKLGVLKMETAFDVMGQQVTMTWQVSNLASKVTIGEQTFTGREMTVTSAMSFGTSTITMVSSQDVPGGSLKRDMTSEMMGRKTTSSTVVSSYVKKPLAATTPSK